MAVVALPFFFGSGLGWLGYDTVGTLCVAFFVFVLLMVHETWYWYGVAVGGVWHFFFVVVFVCFCIFDFVFLTTAAFFAWHGITWHGGLAVVDFCLFGFFF